MSHVVRARGDDALTSASRRWAGRRRPLGGMVVALSASLTAHQKATPRLPSVALTASPTRGSVELLPFALLYLGTEADCPHAATLAADGSLIRAQNRSGTVYVSRVTSPSSATTVASWQTWSSLAASFSGAGVALAARSGEVLCLYTTNSGKTLTAKTSSDNGATWSAATNIVTEASAIGSIAVAFTGSDACAFYTIGTSTTLNRLRRTSGTWAAAGTNWSRSASVASITGVAACYFASDFHLVVTGTEVTTAHKRAYGVVMGDAGLPANTWSSLVAIAESDSASNTTFAGPAIGTPGSNLHAFFAQAEAGNVAVNRVVYSRPPAATGSTGTWTEPAHTDAESAYGAALALSSTTVLLCTPKAVRAATLAQTATLSSRLVSATYRITPDGASCRLELDNHDGGLASSTALIVGGTVTITPGYRSGTAQAVETGVSLAFLVDSITRTVRNGRATVTVDASSPLDQLARWTPPQSWQVAASVSTRAAIAARVAARAGFSLASASSPFQPSRDWTAYSPAFRLAPGEHGASALDRILDVALDFPRADSGAIAIAGIQRYRNEVLADSPVGYWRLDDLDSTTALDHSGFARNGTYSGTYRQRAPGMAAGDPAGSTVFDGATARVDVADNNAWSIDTTGKLTVEAVVNIPANNGANQVLVAKSNAAGEWALYLAPDDNLYWIIWTAAYATIGVAGAPFTYGSAVHVAATVDTALGSNHLKLFINGAQVATGAYAGGYAAGADPLQIGVAFGTSFPIAGKVQDVAVYATALSAARILVHYQALNPSDYAYGGSAEHPVYELVTRDQLARENVVRVQSADRYADQVIPAQLNAAGSRFKLLRNLDATTDDKARRYAFNAAHRANALRPAATLRAPFNAGQQLYDIVSVTDSRLGLSSQRYRVVGIGLDYQAGPKSPRYDTILDLAAL